MNRVSNVQTFTYRSAFLSTLISALMARDIPALTPQILRGSSEDCRQQKSSHLKTADRLYTKAIVLPPIYRVKLSPALIPASATRGNLGMSHHYIN
jgi:hypothetical protein